MTTPIDCETAMRRLWDFLDAELDDARAAALEAHLATCDRCPPHVAFFRELRRTVAVARHDHEAPDALRARVVAALAADGFTAGRT
jgi:mycothiol system anti-sigma-R factor